MSALLLCGCLCAPMHVAAAGRESTAEAAAALGARAPDGALSAANDRSGAATEDPALEPVPQPPAGDTRAGTPSTLAGERGSLPPQAQPAAGNGSKPAPADRIGRQNTAGGHSALERWMLFSGVSFAAIGAGMLGYGAHLGTEALSVRDQVTPSTSSRLAYERYQQAVRYGDRAEVLLIGGGAALALGGALIALRTTAPRWWSSPQPGLTLSPGGARVSLSLAW